METHRLYVALLLSLLFLAACDTQDTRNVEPEPVIVSLAAPLATAEPEEMGFDRLDLARALLEAETSMSSLKSLLVVRHGRVVAERYYQGHTADALHDVRSVTKSVLSILFGIALERGDLDGLDQPLSTYVDEELATLTPDKGQIRLDHLITMTSGLQWDEWSSSDYLTWRRSPDHIQYVLDKPFEAAPGTFFRYNSGGTHLLSVVLQTATGLTAKAYAEQHLFSRLGIEPTVWQTDNRGFSNGGAGLQLRTRDMAKLGLLMLQQGYSGAAEVLPADWVAASVTPRQPMDWTISGLNDIAYGYLWWIDEGHRSFWAWGYGGQFIYVDPDLDLVVVATSEWIGQSSASISFHESKSLDVIVNHIIPSIRP